MSTLFYVVFGVPASLCLALILYLTGYLRGTRDTFRDVRLAFTDVRVTDLRTGIRHGSGGQQEARRIHNTLHRQDRKLRDDAAKAFVMGRTMDGFRR